MKTNLRTIMGYDPCDRGIAILMNNLGYNCTKDNWEEVYNALSDEQKYKDIDFKFILKSNGIDDTFWALRTQDKKTRMLINADIAESVLHIYEKHYPNDMRVRDCIEGVRKYANGEITEKELRKFKKAAESACDDSFFECAASDAAQTASNAASNICAIIAYFATCAARSAARDYAYSAREADEADDVAYANQCKKNEEILMKYL